MITEQEALEAVAALFGACLLDWATEQRSARLLRCVRLPSPATPTCNMCGPLRIAVGDTP